MPTTRRTRRLAATPEEVWTVVGDPHHLPRWWPRATRVEQVHRGTFTLVLTTDKGKPVRVDQRVLESVSPARRRWAQEVDDTPFARVLRSAETAVELVPDSGGTQVTLELRQAMRGMSRLGSLMVSRAGRRQLETALDGLERICG